MIKANVKYFGKQQNTLLLPTPFHSYLVISSPWQTNDSGIASVLSFSNAPMPNPPYKLTTTGGEKLAYDEMLQVLRSMPENKDLTELIDED